MYSEPLQNNYSLSWVVEDMVDTVRAEVGVFHWRDWPDFVAACGLQYDFEYLPPKTDAILHNNIILFRHGISEDRVAEKAFEEAGQAIFLPACDIRDWKRCPGGDVMITKLKRRARGFAKLFPLGRPAHSFWPCDLRNPEMEATAT